MLGVLSGKGFIIAEPVGKFLSSGQFVVNFPVAFNKDKKDESTGQWERDKSIVVRVAAFGKLGEFINENFTAKTEIELSGDLYMSTYQKKDDGGEGQSVEMIVRTVSGPIQKRDGGGQSFGGGAKTASPSNDW